MKLAFVVHVMTIDEAEPTAVMSVVVDEVQEKTNRRTVTCQCEHLQLKRPVGQSYTLKRSEMKEKGVEQSLGKFPLTINSRDDPSDHRILFVVKRTRYTSYAPCGKLLLTENVIPTSRFNRMEIVGRSLQPNVHHWFCRAHPYRYRNHVAPTTA